MIHITLSAERRLDDPSSDALGRDRVGYAETMSSLALYDANHGTWVLGPKADTERFALFTFKGVVRQAVEIDRLEKVDTGGGHQHGRSIIHGRILEAGSPVYDQYVGKTSPVQGVRNPVTYFNENVASPCLCRCGGSVASARPGFLPGHDQTALHDRVRQIGTVAEFLIWFDIVRGNTGDDGDVPASV